MSEFRARLVALEKRQPADCGVVIVRIRRFGSGGEDDDGELRTLRTGLGHDWTRAVGETEEAFIARARREAPRPGLGGTLVLVS